jgi:hypothetical protein
MTTNTAPTTETTPSAIGAEVIQKSGPDTLKAQCIPTDPAILGIEGYKAFLAECRKAVSHRLNEFLGAAAR